MAKGIDSNLILIGGALGLGALFLIQQKKGVEETLGGVATGVSGIGQGVSTGFQGIGTGVSDAFIGAGSGLGTASKSLGEGLGTVFQEVGQTVGGVGDFIQTGLREGQQFLQQGSDAAQAYIFDQKAVTDTNQVMPYEKTIDTLLRAESAFKNTVGIAIPAVKLIPSLSGLVAQARQLRGSEATKAVRLQAATQQDLKSPTVVNNLHLIEQAARPQGSPVSSNNASVRRTGSSGGGTSSSSATTIHVSPAKPTAQSTVLKVGTVPSGAKTVGEALTQQKGGSLRSDIEKKVSNTISSITKTISSFLRR